MTPSAPISVSSRLRGVTPPRAALADWSQWMAASRSSKTSSPRATTRARRISRDDSSLLSRPSRLRRARVRSGIPTAAASSDRDRWVSRVRASIADAGMPRRMRVIQSSAERGIVARTGWPPSRSSIASAEGAVGAAAGYMGELQKCQMAVIIVKNGRTCPPGFAPRLRHFDKGLPSFTCPSRVRGLWAPSSRGHWPVPGRTP